jgi:hypothetical protein
LIRKVFCLSAVEGTSAFEGSVDICAIVIEPEAGAIAVFGENWVRRKDRISGAIVLDHDATIIIVVAGKSTSMTLESADAADWKLGELGAFGMTW